MLPLQRGYDGYPSMHPSYSMGYQQQQQSHDAKREGAASYPPQRFAPQFVNKSPKQESTAPASASNAMPPTLPSCNEAQATKPAELPKKKKKKSKYDEDPNKKPPRPYTEYNIFFQLERERILMDLEKQHQLKEVGYVKEEDEEVVHNQPSDEHDVLPRPPRFAHLKLLPKWYDSKHRLAENKKNKEKRKHRKTHGLVGFLDLTRRIAKEWSEAEDEVKFYCKQVAKRQLGYYKEELKVWKKTQESNTIQAAAEKQVEIKEVLEKKTAPVLSAPKAPIVEKMPELPALKTAKPSGPSLPQVIHRSMPPPPAQNMYPPHLVQRNVHWQQSHYQHGHFMNRNYPTMPVLSPSMDCHDDHRYYPMPMSNRHPLDELMHRRNLYGSRSTMMQPTRARKRKTEEITILESKDTKDEVTSPSGGDVREASSFLSPEDTGSPNNDANAAITPSPSSRGSGHQDHLPMKKRRNKMPGDDSGVSDVSPGSFGQSSPGNGPNSNDIKLSPFDFSPSDGMIMTPNGDAFMGQMMGMSPSLGQWNNESPFPYIDCFSPHEGVPTVAPQGDSYRRPSMASAYPSSPYVPSGGQWDAPPLHQYPFDANMNMGINTEEVFDSSVDLDDEELQLMRRLQATRAKKLRQKHLLMQQHAIGSQDWVHMAQSPGGPMSNNYSFASPVEKPAVAEPTKK